MVPDISLLALDRRSVALAAVGGISHLALVAALWLWFGFTTRVADNEAFLVYTTLGAVALGAVPTLLIAARRLASPLVVVGGTGLATAAQTWLVYVAPQTPPAPVGPTPFGWYLVGWPVVAAVALAGGATEHRLRRTGPRTGT
ncbi:hypothetical protein [Halomicrobium katesii]|uniref:hypothetical protein n=1 Tax=Halomicrobium katesii TaxID=437163 RepID=UPI0003828AD5|nr:hypothetical protein [Halomicrobium katesii]